MKHQWLAYVIVGVLSVGAGVAIAGLPDNVPVEATIVPPTTVVAPDPTVTTTTSTTTPTTTEPSTTAPQTTEPEATTPDTTPETTDASSGGLPERAAIATVAANGANVEGAAAAMAAQLETIGYVDVTPRNGSDIVEFTTIYFAPGFEEAADRLAADLDVVADFVAPIDDAPAITGLPDGTELIAYIGRDRA